MSDVTELLKRFADRSAQVDSSHSAINPPATEADWKRFNLIYPTVNLPDDVAEMYRLMNGMTASAGLLRQGFQRLPFDKPPSSRLCGTAPCPLHAQLPIVVDDEISFVVLLDGDHYGEIWTATVNPELLHRHGRVAHSFTHLLEQMVSVLERYEEAESASFDKSAIQARFPAINSTLLCGYDLRSPDLIAGDGGYGPIYQTQPDLEWERAWSYLRQRDEAYDKEAMQWRQANFPSLRQVPPVG